jgi:nucleoside triphosphatase
MNHPEPVVGAIIFNSNNEVLLCQSNKWKGKFVVPGGHIEFGERMHEALIREVLEETALPIYDVQLVCIKENIFVNSKEQTKHYILFDFTCRTDSYDVVLNEEAEAYFWVKLDHIFDFDLDPFTHLFFKYYLDESSDRINVLFNIS